MAYPSESYLGKVLRWVRKFADEPIARVKYTDADLVDLWCGSMDGVMVDVYAMADTVPRARATITLVAGQDYYMFPPNVGTLERLSVLDATTGICRWEVDSRALYHPWGPGYVLDGNQGIRFIPKPQLVTGDLLTVEYIPSGIIYPHLNVAPVFAGTGDAGTQIITASGMRLGFPASNLFIGRWDRRPNAFLGQRVRLLGTTNGVVPSGLSTPFTPIQERSIMTYDLYTHATIGWSPNLDTGVDFANASDPVDPETLGLPAGDDKTYVIYEVLPSVDEGILWLGALETARMLIGVESKGRKQSWIEAQTQRTKRSLQLRWATFNARTGQSMRTDTIDADPSYWGFPSP